MSASLSSSAHIAIKLGTLPSSTYIIIKLRTLPNSTYIVIKLRTLGCDLNRGFCTISAPPKHPIL
jgi:hypothetical protein